MKKSMKIALVSAVLLVIAVSVVAYGATAWGLTPGNVNATSSQQLKSDPDRRAEQLLTPVGLKSFLAHAQAVEINGTVVAQVRSILVLDTTSGRLNIILPPAWTVGNVVMSRAKLFNGTFSGIGQMVTVKALKSTVFDGSNFDIVVIFGYEIINSSGVHAFAVLPFNIETKS